MAGPFGITYPWSSESSVAESSPGFVWDGPGVASDRSCRLTPVGSGQSRVWIRQSQRPFDNALCIRQPTFLSCESGTAGCPISTSSVPDKRPIMPPSEVVIASANSGELISSFSTSSWIFAATGSKYHVGWGDSQGYRSLTELHKEIEHRGHSTYGSREPGSGNGVSRVRPRRPTGVSANFI